MAAVKITKKRKKAHVTLLRTHPTNNCVSLLNSTGDDTQVN